MNFEDTKKLINNVIENEFRHIQEYKELEALNEDKKRLEEYNKAAELLKNILEVVPEEYRDMIGEYEVLTNDVWLDYCRYYFNRGVIAGMTKLKFLEDTKIVGAL